MKTVFAYCFLGLLALLGVSATIACIAGARPVSPDVVVVGPPPNAPVVKSFRELYPFAGETSGGRDERPRASEGVARIGLPKWLSAYRDRMRRCFRTIDTRMSGKGPLSGCFRRVARSYDEVTRNCVAMDGYDPVVRLDNGSYSQIFPYCEASESWTNVQAFASWLGDRGIRCLHVLSPFKFDDSMTTFPAGIPHGYARLAAEYRRNLAKHKIPCLDAKEPLLAANPDFHSWFGKLYLNYTAHAGLTIARATARTLREELGVDADVEALADGNFTRCVYPRRYRPSYALGSDFETEDVEVYYPHVDGRFRVEVPSRGLVATGGFHDTLIVQPYLKAPSENSYAAFLHGYPALIRVENLACANHSRVLILRRCDARVVCPYLACAVRHLDVLSPCRFDGSVRTFVERTRPDVVVFCTYMQTGARDSFWELR